MGQFQSVARFINPAYAHMALAKLKSEEIECYLADEHTITTFPHFGPAMGGVRLMVMQKGFQQANELLDLYQNNDLDLHPDEIEAAARQEEQSFVEESSLRKPLGMGQKTILYILLMLAVVIYVNYKFK